MNITINFKNHISSKFTGNSILFVDEKFNISTLKKYILSSEYSYINDLLKTKDDKKKIITFDINSRKKIILISLKKNNSNSEAENLGAQCYNVINVCKSFIKLHTRTLTYVIIL